MGDWNHDIEQGDVHRSFPIEIAARETELEWKKSLNAQLQTAESPLPDSCCIFKVPEVLKRQNTTAYEPDIVSIGPYHRGCHEKFQLVENVKKWYLKLVLTGHGVTLDSLIERIKGMEQRARRCYSEPCINLDSNQFIEMLMLDGCFLIELFRKELDKDQQDKHDPIFNVACMLEYLFHDLLLLENQLPWFVLEFLYDFIEFDKPHESLIDVVIKFFKQSMADPKIFDYPTSAPRPRPVLHILDVVRTALVQDDRENENTYSSELLNKDQPTIMSHLPQRIPCVTTLSEAGVDFKRGYSNCILDLRFENGVFTIPPLAIDERTGPLFRNLMAFEQCYRRTPHLITSYAVLMDNLIDCGKDVDILKKEKIVTNWLSAEDASKFFNDLYNDTTVINYKYTKLCKDVEDYHGRLVPKMMEKLRRDYFETPWSAIAFVAATFLMVLSILQTAYAIQSYYHPPS